MEVRQDVATRVEKHLLLHGGQIEVQTNAMDDRVQALVQIVERIDEIATGYVIKDLQENFIGHGLEVQSRHGDLNRQQTVLKSVQAVGKVLNARVTDERKRTAKRRKKEREEREGEKKQRELGRDFCICVLSRH